MQKFLHIADIHLGIRRYRSEERTLDFFNSWKDCLERYAIAEKVSFVLIAGDFFDVRRVEPQAMNQAIAGLELLRSANIPVLAIEGNHDQHEATNRFSWLRSLSQWGYMSLLEPEYEGGRPIFRRWDEETRTGSFIDIEGIRVFGSNWYGSTGNLMIPRLGEALNEHRSETHFNVCMLHTDVEGQLNRPIPAVTIEELSVLKASIDYLALGHTHKNFEVDGWIFNPGSLEACNVDEFDYRRGAYLVEVEGGRAVARLVEDYARRPTHRVRLGVNPEMTPEAIESVLMTVVRQEMQASLRRESDLTAPWPASMAPVIDVVIDGVLGFEPSLLEINRLREEIRQEFGALLVLLRNRARPVAYPGSADLAEHMTRAERERRVIEDLVGRDARFRDRTTQITALIVEAKRMALNDEDGSRIAELIQGTSDK